ncbi:Vps62-related protein [Myxococcus fulvus]|uniref:Vps62-related protein n=1 Tax=Myxococcus fulvus TaxID=33 RepID=UPI003B9BDEFF
MPRRRGWKQWSALAVLCIGCQPLSPDEVSAEPGPGELDALPVVEQPLGPLRERSCQEIRAARPTAGDGEYALHLMGDPARPWMAWCHDMAGTPREYLTLRERGTFANFAQYTAGDAAPGTTVRTAYQRLRVDPHTLRVDTTDKTFATSTGQLLHANQPVTSVSFATALSCDWADSGRANIDLRGTPFKVATEAFTVKGYAQQGSSVYTWGDQVVALRGGGYCGWTGPADSEGLTGGSLPLFYGSAATTWTPTVAVYSASTSNAGLQSLQPGWYDAHELSVGEDAIHSVRVPRGWVLTLYPDRSFKGTPVTLTSDTDLTGRAIDQKTSSLKVEAPVTIYKGNHFQGASQQLLAGRYDLGQLTIGNDTLRSIRVPEGYRVTLYWHSGFQGDQVVLTQDTDFTGQPFQANTSSLIVESTTERDDHNTMYGRWAPSGGQLPNSRDNRPFIVDYTGAPDVVTFELEASVGPYLYLLDTSNRVLAEVNNLDGGTVARISYYLSPGTYRLVAATTLTGRTGEFTLRSDKARLRAPLRLWVQATSGFDWIYDDYKTGAHSDLSVWRPNLSQLPGHYALGDVAMPGRGVVPRTTLVVKGEGDVLARPVDYTFVWNDSGTGGRHDVGFWHPVAPPGYTCLGSVVQLGYDKPSTDLIRCVRSEYVVPGGSSWVWNDQGSGGHHDGSVFQTGAQDHRALTVPVMVGNPGYDAPDTARFWALNKSMLANPELQGGLVDELAALQFAPRIYLAPGEYYLPSSVEFFLANVHDDGRFLWTNQALGCPSCTNPPFLGGQRPDQTHVPVYIQKVRRTSQGRPTNVTDLIYWTFYPYNAGKEVCIGADTEIGCIGGKSTFGNHVGDWEHLTVRFIDGRPAYVYMSQHSEGGFFEFGNKAMALEGFRPTAYAAKGSHALYASPGEFAYEHIPVLGPLVDVTGHGVSWNTWDRPVIFHWQPMGTFTGSLAWLNITSDWGNDKAGCDNIATQISGQCILNAGPTAPMLKGFAHPSAMTME